MSWPSNVSEGGPVLAVGSAGLRLILELRSRRREDGPVCAGCTGASDVVTCTSSFPSSGDIEWPRLH